MLVLIFYLMQPILTSLPSVQYMSGLQKPVRAFVGAQAERNRSERSLLTNNFCKRRALAGRIEVQMSEMLCDATPVRLWLKHTSV